MRTALVTGAAGFIGSYLTERLVETDCHVVALDSLLWGAQRIEHLVRGQRVSLERGDVRDESFMTRVVAHGPFDIVYHLAALAYIPYCASHSVETISVNVLGTQVLLEALKGQPPHRFVFASSGDVYAPKSAPHVESDPLGPFSIYGVSKMFGEQLIAAAMPQMPETSFVTARFFNVYGLRGTNPYVIPSIIAQLKKGNRVCLGNTWPRRDFVHVRDVVEALLVIGTHGGNNRFECFNIGTGLDRSIEDVVEALGGVLGIEVVLEADSNKVRPVERPHLQASIAKLQESTGWKPRYSLQDGLRELCVHEQLLKAP